jgi:hypothetical protein
MSDCTRVQEIAVVEAGEGRCRIEARLLPVGDHLSITVTGGEAHIGAVALAEPYPSRTDPEKISASVSIITRTTHKEDDIARRVSSRVTSAARVPVLVCCGIHLDRITGDEIEKIHQNVELLIENIILKISGDD